MSRSDRGVPDICPVQSAGQVVTWPIPLTEKPFPLYKLTVDGIDVPVWSGRVREDIHQPADAGFTHMYNGPTEWCGFARFDFAGSVEVAVTVDRDFDSAEIVPRSAGIACAVNGRTVHFRMDEPRPLTLLLDGCDREPLHLFTHRPETDVPSPDDPNVIYFGPGEHWVDTIQVRSGQTVYLDGGALIRAVLPPGAQGKRSGGVLNLVGYPGGPVIDVSEAADVQIRGRGILDGTALPHPVRNLIRLHRSRNVRVEGITLRNSPNWHLPIVDCDEVEVDGLCGLSGRLNSDGINCVSSRQVTVRNCFMRTHDDTYAVKTTVPERPSEHIRYERCVAWNDWGFALGVTYETRADIRDVAFTDCDVIFARWWPIGVHATDGGAIEDIRFERIGVDCPQSAIAPHMGRALARIDNQKDCWSTEPGIARVRDILLRDIDVSGQAFDRIDIHGNDAEHPITDVRFENVRINGEPLDAGKVAVNEHVHDWVVRPDNFDIPRTSDYVVSVGGQPSAVYAMPTRYGQTFENGKPVSVYDGAPLRQPMYFACVDIGGPTTVTVEIGFLPVDDIRSVTAHPLSRGIEVRREGARVTFDVDRPGTVTLLVNGDHRDRPLHLFFSPPGEAPPEGAIVFGPGYHDLGYDNPITLTGGQTLYLAPGAWVEGIVRATDARNIRIMGRGVLSQRRPGKLDYAGGATAPNGIVLSNCQDVLIEGIVETRGIGGWCSLVTNCDRVEVRDYHVLASVVWSADGFNPCNSRDVTVERCFIRSGDDCIAIKGNTGGSVLSQPHIPPETQPPVENIHVRRSVFWCDHNEVFVIGCETRARHIRNVSIRDCDVLFHWSSMDMGVFGILPLHGTEIRGIVYDDIRVEHCEEHLFYFRFCESIWAIPGDLTFPGTVADITIRNVSVLHAATGPRSEISGYAPDKRFESITIENLRYGGKPVTDAAGMGLRLNEHVADVRFANNSNIRRN